MQIPAVIYLMINMVGLGVMMVNHGKPTTTNFWGSLLTWVFLVLPLLYWGNFFTA